MMGTALETALKLEETCLRPVRGYSYADLRHGPISVVTSGVLAVLVGRAATARSPRRWSSSPATSQSRGARILGHRRRRAFAGACDVHLAGRGPARDVAPLAAIVPAQLMVERLARDLGLDPDNPRGLAKVTSDRPRP